jgi:hypothetical protein
VWQREEGRDLFAALEGNGLPNILPESPAIYAWKINTVPFSILPYQSGKVLELVNDLLSTPQGEIVAKRLNHSLVIERMVIQGKPLAKSDAEQGDKYKNLQDWLKVQKNCQWMIHFLGELGEMLPPLYVGKAKNLRKRTRGHLIGDGGVGDIVRSHASGDWNKVALYYMEAPLGTSDGVLEALEFVTQSMSISSFTKRVG